MRSVVVIAILAGTLFCYGILSLENRTPDPTLHVPVILATELARGITRTLQEPIIVDPSWERSLGEEMRASLGAQVSIDPYVSQIGSHLVRYLDDSPYRYEFHLITMANPNAFATPGGIIYVSSGLLSFIEYEAELAVVLGHEIMHVERGHLTDALKGEAVGKRLGGSNPLELLQVILRIGYSQSQETESDRDGVELSSRAGYAPMAGVTFFEKLGPYSRSQTKPGADRILWSAIERYFESHPPAEERRETVLQLIRDYRIRWKDRRFYWGKQNVLSRISVSKKTFMNESLHLGETP